MLKSPKISRLLTLFAAAALIACGDDSGDDDSNNGGSEGGGNKGTPAPCSLASVADVQRIVEDQVTTAEDDTMVLEEPTCRYFDAEGFDVFQLLIFEGGAAEYDALKALADGGSIPDLGQDAVADFGGAILVKTSTLSFLAIQSLAAR